MRVKEDGRQRTMQFAIGAGENAPVVVSGRSSTGGAWGKNILRMYEALPFEITVEQGWNDIVIYRMDPSMLLDRFVIETKEGALAQSLRGPVESPNNIVGYQPARVAKLPDELNHYEPLPNVTLHPGETTSFEVEGAISVFSSYPSVAAAASPETR